MVGENAGEKNPNTVFVTQSTSTAISYRVAEYFLCAACEGRLNNGGEIWTLKNAYRGGVAFPLRDVLMNVSPLGMLSQGKMIDASSLPKISISKLVYFATSVFWKASGREWRGLDHPVKLDFGPYEQQFRHFLLGKGPFPDRAALLISVSGNSKPHVVAIYPYGGKPLNDMRGARQYRFAIPGMAFWLQLGEISAALRALCAHHSGILFLASDLNEMFMRDGTALFAKLDQNRKRLKLGY
jgi:hypothetical protein